MFCDIILDSYLPYLLCVPIGIRGKQEECILLDIALLWVFFPGSDKYLKLQQNLATLLLWANACEVTGLSA